MPLFRHAHIAAALVDVPRPFAFEQLSDAGCVGAWSLGSMNLVQVAPGVFRGESLFDGSAAYVEILPLEERGLVDFAVGTAQTRVARISIRVTAGEVLGHDEGTCMVTMSAMRPAKATDAQWEKTCTSHETEILLIKAQLETAFAKVTA